jgi:para-nitrobenzyl esterase
LHTLPVEQLIAAITPAKQKVGRSELPLLDRYDYGPVADGSDLPQQPCDPAPATFSDDIPLLIGDTKDEATRFLADEDAVWNRTLTEAQLRERLSAIAGGEAGRLFDLYRTRDPSANPAELLIAALTHAQFSIRSALFAERKAARGKAPVYLYSLAWETPAFEGRLKAPHALDLPFVFDNTEVAEGTAGAPGARELAAVMAASWLAFARTGNPQTDALPEWPTYTADQRSVMVFDHTCRTVTDPDRDARLLWGRIATTAR